MIKKGKLITFEGGEGTGKSTQALKLADYLKGKNIPVLLTREPGGSTGAELIRSLLVQGDPNRWSPLSEVLLLCAARLDHWEKTILPALLKGQWVICDRFFDSTVAYQGHGHGIDLNFLHILNSTILPLSTPDLTYIFDLDPEIGVRRSLKRANVENRFEQMDLSFHYKLKSGYLQIAKDNSKRCHLIKADQTVEAIYKQVCYIIDPLVLSTIIL